MTTLILDDMGGDVNMLKRKPTSLEAADRQEWSAICQMPGCLWRRDELPTFEAASTKAETHSRITALDGAAHPVLPVGRITVTGAVIVWRDR